MSVLLENYTKEQSDFIVKNLSIVPESEVHSRGAHAGLDRGCDPVQFWLPEIVYGEPGQVLKASVRVPFSTGAVLSRGYPNSGLVRPYQPSPIEYNFTGTLRTEPKEHSQVDIVAEAEGYLSMYNTVLINGPPAIGKTTISYYLGRGGIGCVLLPFSKTCLIQSWVTTALERTDGIIWVIGETITPEQRATGRFVDWNEGSLGPNGSEVVPHIIICMIQRVHLIPSDLRDSVTNLYLDEVPLLCVPSAVEGILSFRPKRVICLSGSPERSGDGMHRMMQALVGKHEVYREPILPFTYVLCKTGFKPSGTTNSMGVDWGVLTDEIFTDLERNAKLVELALQTPPGEKVMIYTTRLDHIELLYQIFTALGETVCKLSGEDKTLTNSRILIINIQSGGVGFDEATSIPGFDGIKSKYIIAATTWKKPEVWIQLGGRFRVPGGVLYIFVDDNGTVKRHYGDAKRTYKNRKGTEAKLELPDGALGRIGALLKARAKVPE